MLFYSVSLQGKFFHGVVERVSDVTVHIIVHVLQHI
ncbi:MAG: hypothetical protein ACI8QY_001190, partial [bacterium]